MSENQETAPVEKKETIKISDDSWHYNLARKAGSPVRQLSRGGEVTIGEYLVFHILPSAAAFAAKAIAVIIVLFFVLTTIGITTAFIGTAVYQAAAYLWALIPAGVAIWKWVAYPLSFVFGIIVTINFFDHPDDVIDIIAALPSLIFSVALTGATVIIEIFWTIAAGLGARKLFTSGPLKELTALWNTPIEIV